MAKNPQAPPILTADSAINTLSLEHNNALKEWDIVIEPSKSVFDIQWKDLWRYRDLLALLVRRDFVSFYKQTVLGPLWFFIQPLFTTITYMIVFGRLAGLKTDDLPQPLFYMVGIVAWNYFSECLTKTSTVFRDNANMFGKVYFPRLIMPLSIVASNLVKFGVQVLLFLLIFFYYVLFKGYHPATGVHIFLFPLTVLLLAGLGLGIGLIVSAMTTKYRDLSYLVTFGVQLMMYATPVIYPLSSAPQKYRWIISANPISGVIETMRFSLLGAGQYSIGLLAYSTVSCLVLIFFGLIMFNKVERNFVDTI